jgi:REP-associated tyrosine transposase
VTIATQNRECIFGEIVDCEMRLNDVGEIARECWLEVADHFPRVALDEFVVMPNHVHGVLTIQDDERRSEVASPQSSRGETQTGGDTPPLRKTVTRRLGNIVAYYKYETKKRINAIRDWGGARIWQRNYYEHIARNERELNRVREYISNNPANWNFDGENLKNVCHET